MFKKLSVTVLTAIFFVCAVTHSAFAQEKLSRTKLSSRAPVAEPTEAEEDADTVAVPEGTAEVADTAVNAKREAPTQEVCGFEVPEEKNYDASLVTVRRRLQVEPGEEFRVKIFMQNTGNMPWFSNESSCLGPRAYLGTDRGRDRTSIFYSELLKSDNNWTGTNRVAMDQLRVDPGQIASFTFWSVAGQEPDVYKEYMTPMIDAVTWMDDAMFSYEVMVGDSEESMTDLRKKVLFAYTSGSVLDINLDGEKSVLVDLSDQMGYLMLDGVTVKEFRVSTGAAATPTPVGVTSIILKQEVRVANKYPHYIMPNFMMFRAGGYGFHALPSLGNDGGVFWTEAREHIGIPVSHGCIRMLPEDSDFSFEFLEVGSTVTVQY